MAVIVTPVAAVKLLLGHQALFRQGIEINKVRIARIGREGLIRRVAVAGRSDGEDLPNLLAGFFEEVRKLAGLFADCSDAIGGRKRSD